MKCMYILRIPALSTILVFVAKYPVAKYPVAKYPVAIPVLSIQVTSDNILLSSIAFHRKSSQIWINMEIHLNMKTDQSTL